MEMIISRLPHNRHDIHAALVGGEIIQHNDAILAPPRLLVNVTELAENPQEYLIDVAAHGLRSIRFLNADGTEQPGIDVGGPTKQFIHMLLDALRTKEIIKLNEKGIPTSTENPTTPESNWILVGKLISAIHDKNVYRTDKIFTGQIFNQKTFGLLKLILDASKTEDEKLLIIGEFMNNPFSNPLIEFAKKSDPTGAEIESIKTYLRDSIGSLEDEDDPKVEELKNLCLLPFKESVYKALQALATGLSDLVKEKISSKGDDYSIELQGRELPSAADICDKLHYDGGNPYIEQKIVWLKEKITLERTNTDSDWIKRFLICVTGQPVLPAGKIHIRGLLDEYVCKTHTCVNILDLPISNLTPHIEGDFTIKEKFIMNLEITMTGLSHDAT
jgi:hypothetical protein